MNTFKINIDRHLYSYGFELKDEAKPYKKYAVVSKITSNAVVECGLKVGDKIVSINGENVAGKDYISLRNNIRKSVDNCVRLEIIKEMDFQMMSPDPLSPQVKFTPFKLGFGRNLIPSGSIREKIRVFQNTSRNGSVASINRSNSCDCVNKTDSHLLCTINNVFNNSLQKCSISVDNLMKDLESSEFESEINVNNMISQNSFMEDSLSISYHNSNIDVTHAISQDPFSDESLTISHNVINIQLPSNSVVRVIETKSADHIESPLLLKSYDTVFELVSEPFEDKPIKKQLIPKLEMPEFPYSYSISSDFDQLSPGFINTKSRSSHNLFGETTKDWALKSPNIINCPEYGSMTNIKLQNNMSNYATKEISRQPSILTNIPIKLRVLQFHDKAKSKSWKDYIIEPEPNGARFRKRYLENLKSDRTTNFIIRFEDVNKFEVESPRRRHKTSSGRDYSCHERFSLMAFNGRVHIKFHFNPTIFQDDFSSNEAYSTYMDIIKPFKSVDSKLSNSINPFSLSQSSSINLSLYDTQSSVTAQKELNSSIEEFSNVDRHNSASNSYKSISKSSAENLSATTFEISQSSSRSIFKQAIGKIKPEKKVKITQTYQVFTGTKAEFEEFQKQLEGGHLPLELDGSDENSVHFNRYIYEVPRMSVNPKIPMIIYLCTEIVEKMGLRIEGIYRISGNQRMIRTLSNTLHKSLDHIEYNLPEWRNVHAVCGTLKLFLRKLKQYLIPADLSHVLAYSCKGVDCDNPSSLAKTLMDIRYHLSSSYQIPSRRRCDSNIIDQVACRWQSLQYILKHLAKVVGCRQYNNMDEHAISVCFNPVIMESWQNNINDIKADNEIMVKALELILVHQDWLFNNWNSEMNCSWSLELVDNAQSYATEFIDKKYDFYNKIRNENEFIEENDLDVNKMVEQIIAQSTINFSEKRKLGRRHSSHTPGQKPLILNDEMDVLDSDNNLHRNSQTTEALDLFSCASWMKQFAKVPTIDENKEIKVDFIVPSTEPNCDEYEPYIPDTRFIRKQQVPLTRIVVDSSVSKKDVSSPNNKNNQRY